MIKPLNRDQQIELMESMSERTAGRISRWKKDEVVKSVLDVPPHAPDESLSYTRHDRLLACG